MASSKSKFSPERAYDLIKFAIDIENPQFNLYFLTDGEAVKIGIAKDMYDRLHSIQTGNPREIRVLFVLPCESKLAANDAEWLLHRLFEKHHLRGEWFDIIQILEKNEWVDFFKKIQETAAENCARRSRDTANRIYTLLCGQSKNKEETK